MLKTQGMGRTVAVSVTLGMSLLVAGGCKHCRHQSQPTAAGECRVCSPNYGSGAIYEPPAGEYQPGLPPSVPPATDEFPMPGPMEEADAPAEAEAIPQRRNPIQAIKDGLRPLGSKFGRLLKRERDTVVEEEAVGTERVTSPDLGASGPEDVSPQLGVPAQPLPSRLSDTAYPPQVPPAADRFSADDFESEYEFDDVEEDADLFGLPEENVPGDLELSPETPQQQSLPLPITEPQSDLDIYEPVESAPAPTLAPPPAIESSPEPKYDFGDEGIEFSNGETESRGPQLLPAPGGDARQVKFVPVKRPALNVYQVGNLAICAEVRSFQDFTEMDRSGLRPGQEILIYNTLHNFVSVESPQGFRTLTRSKIEWLGPGERVLQTAQLAEAPDASRSLRRDYFLTHHIVVPSKLSPGLYTLRLTVEDLYGHQAAHATMQVEVVK